MSTPGRGPTIVAMVRPSRLAALAAFPALVAALAAGCGGGSAVATGEPISFGDFARAASTSADATTGRFGFSMEMTFPAADEPFAFAGDGAFDATANRASLTIDMSSFASSLGGLFAGAADAGGPDLDDPDAWTIEAVQDGFVMYMRFPAVADQLPRGKSWVRMDLRKGGSAQGIDLEQLQQFTNSGPRDILDYLRAVSGEIETVGTDELRGVETTHYYVIVDLLRYEKLAPPAQRETLRSLLGEVVEQSGLGEIPIDVWVDELSLVRKLTMAFSATQPGTTEQATASMSFELYDYRTDVEIELPPAAQVVDASALK